MTDWVGFDLDRTLAHYESGSWPKIGEPVPAMVEVLKEHLAAGVRVKILTARAWSEDPDRDKHIRAVKDWCLKHIGQELEVTAEKDYGMIRFYDDRAVQVEPNTGRLIGCDSCKPNSK